MILTNPHISIRQRSSFFLLNADSLNWDCADGIWKSRCLAIRMFVIRLDVNFDGAEAKLAVLDSGIKSGYDNHIEF